MAFRSFGGHFDHLFGKAAHLARQFGYLQRVFGLQHMQRLDHPPPECRHMAAFRHWLVTPAAKELRA